MRSIGFAVLIGLVACDKPSVDDTEVDVSTEIEADTEPGTEFEVDTELDTEEEVEPDTDTPPIATCDDSLVVTTFPYRLTGASFADDFPEGGDYNAGSSCGSARGAHPSHRIEVQGQLGQMLVVVEQTSLDAIVYVVDGCDAGDDCLHVHDDPDDGFEWMLPDSLPHLVVLSVYNDRTEGQEYDFLLDIQDVGP